MTIKMPVVCGIKTHKSVYSKIDEAIAKKDFPIILDCDNVTFTTSMFGRFVVLLQQRTEKAGGSVKLVNVNELSEDCLRTRSINRIVDVFPKNSEN